MGCCREEGQEMSDVTNALRLRMVDDELARGLFYY